MRLEDLNWMDVASYLTHDDRIILVTGATEQHAYLSLYTDILIPTRMALAIAAREQVLIAPPLPFGFSGVFTAFPGTISISRRTFDLVLTEMLQSLSGQGFRKFFILNAHGGNDLSPALLELGGQVVWYDWWKSAAAQRFEQTTGLHIGHANWGENFSFCRVADIPQEDKPEVHPSGWARLEKDPQDRAFVGDGSFGGPYQIADEQMLALFNSVVDDAAAVLRALKTTPPA